MQDNPDSSCVTPPAHSVQLRDAYVAEENEKFYVKQVGWATRVQHEKQRQREQARMEELAECTFRPAIKVRTSKSLKQPNDLASKKHERSNSIISEGRGRSAHVERIQRGLSIRKDREARLKGKRWGLNWMPVATVPVPFKLGIPKCTAGQPCTSPTSVKRAVLSLRDSDWSAHGCSGVVEGTKTITIDLSDGSGEDHTGVVRATVSDTFRCTCMNVCMFSYKLPATS
jgi:hypothetical protein